MEGSPVCFVFWGLGGVSERVEWIRKNTGLEGRCCWAVVAGVAVWGWGRVNEIGFAKYADFKRNGAMDYKLVVFDLDFTVWDAGGVWCDCLTPPFRRKGERILDAADSHVRVYEDIPWALETLLGRGVELGIASRTTQPKWARQLLDLLGLRSYFDFEEIYPSSKVRHFTELKSNSGYDYSDMLFFDDELRNIEEVGELGVRSVHVRNGFRRNHLNSEMNF